MERTELLIIGAGAAGISAASATLDFKVANITSAGNYENAWSNSNHKVGLYGISTSSHKVLWNTYTDYSISTTMDTPASAFSGANGKSTANANYRNASYYVTPSQKA